MRKILTLLVVLASAVSTFVSDPVVGPAEKPQVTTAPKPAPGPVTPPVITGDQTADWMIELKVENVPSGTGVIWDVFTEDGRQVGTVKPIPVLREMAFAGPKGKYNVKVRLVKGEDIKQLMYKVELMQGVSPVPPVPPGPTPIPPLPTPVPPPEPTRKGISYQIVYVVDTKASADSAAPMFANRLLNEQMDKNGHSWRIVTKNNTGPDVQEEIKKSDGKGYPQLFLNDKGGKFKQLQFNAPMKAEDMMKILADNGG